MSSMSPTNDDTSPISSQKLAPFLRQLSDDIRQQAFTHRSRRAQEVAVHETNERLEFLGDAVLELCVSDYLIKAYPKHDEGSLTRYRAAIVRTESLAQVARELSLGDFLELSNQETTLPDDLSDSLLADTFEAVIGALYVDKGYEAANTFINEYLLTHLERFITNHDAKDPKTLLQERVQSEGLEAPTYSVVKEAGPDHDKVFTSAVHIDNNRADLTGTGPSKQKAEQAAAARALQTYFSTPSSMV